MKIWHLSYHHNEHGTCVDWHPSRQSAEKAFIAARLLAEKENYEACNPLVSCYEVKPTKRDFLRFLNHFTPSRDNG